MPKAVIFDWDNTLVDSWPVIHQALNETFAQWRRPLWTREETQQRVQKSMRDSFPALFGDDWKEAGDFYRDRYRALHLTDLKPLPGAADVLDALAAQGVTLAVLSNKTGPILRIEAEALRWTHYFHQLVGAGDLGADKPAPDGVFHILKDTAIDPAACWFVGDSMVDVECARAAGCHVMFYGDHLDYEEGRVALRSGELHVPDHAALLAQIEPLAVREARG